MEDTEDVDLALDGLEMDDPVVAPKEDPRVSPRVRAIALSQPGHVLEDLRPRVDRLHDLQCCGWLVLGDVVVDVEKPLLRLVGPDNLRQDSIRLAISELEMVRPASESAIPRSTMAAKAISRRISSLELSSGWSSMSLMNCSLTVLIR